jgi:hypothetical protein
MINIVAGCPEVCIVECRESLQERGTFEEMIINRRGDITHQRPFMPQSNDSDLGRRVFVVQKEKAVENALDKIRRHVGADWCSISPADCEVLKEILGEIWTAIERPRWSTYRFSKLTLADIGSLVAAGNEIREKHYMTDTLLLSLDRILMGAK